MGDYFGAMGTAIYTTLGGGTALVSALGGTAIYSQHAPDINGLPYVVFNHQGGGPENYPAGLRSNVWFVRAYAASEATAHQIDAEIAELLDGKKLTVAGFNNFWTVREEEFSREEIKPDSTRLYMAGAFYRVRVGY